MVSIQYIKRCPLFKFIWFLLILIIILSCTQNDSVKIGFVTDLSSRNAELGIQARSGLNMAIEEINSNGGIRGRKFEALIANHEGDVEVCKKVVKDLINQGAHIIIGPMISGMATTVIEACEESGILVIGPTVSTDLLTGIDDNFLRIVATASDQGKFLAQALYSMGKTNAVLVLDRKNLAFTSAFSDGFHSTLKGRSLRISEDLYFETKEDFPKIIASLESIEPDSIVFAASGINTAGIIQQYAKGNTVPQLFGASWVKVTNVIEYGGQIVEGMIIIDAYENPEPIEREAQFIADFKEHFSVEPNIAGKSAYEAVKLFADAFRISKSLKSSEIKETILGMEMVEGISDEYSLDAFGDGVRTLSYFIIADGQFKLMPSPILE